MRPIHTYLALIALAALAVPATAQTPDSTVADRREAAKVLDHTFNAPTGEPVRVFLAKNVTYHAETTGTGIQLQLRPLMVGSTQPPLLEPLLSGISAGGEAIYIVKPHADAEYVFTTIGGDATMPVRLRIFAVPAKDKAAAKVAKP